MSDIACPWCVIGLGGLECALERLDDLIEAEVEFHPFELNSAMPSGGQNTIEHVTAKYGMPASDARANRDRIRARAAEVGFAMNTSDSSRIYNTFDAHRLLAWARTKGKQKELKRQLFILTFTDQADPGDPRALAAAAERVGLDPDEAKSVFHSDDFAQGVRSGEALWQSRGITAVPAVIINDRYLISGGQPADEFERQLRRIADDEL